MLPTLSAITVCVQTGDSAEANKGRPEAMEASCTVHVQTWVRPRAGPLLCALFYEFQYSKFRICIAQCFGYIF